MTADEQVVAPATVSQGLAALGPYFALDFHGAQTGPGPAPGGAERVRQRPDAAGSSAPAPRWRPMSELVEVPEVLAERIANVRAFLAAGTAQQASAVELRVAASVVHLGLVARIVSPLLALAVLHRRSGRVQAADLYWQPTLGSMFPLSVREAVLDSSPGLTEGVVTELTEAIARFGVNKHILSGNLASALAGAAKTLTAARPDRRADIRALTSPHLIASGAFEADGTFRRRSCCLIYRAAPDHAGALCGDCVLAPPRGPMDT